MCIRDRRYTSWRWTQGSRTAWPTRSRSLNSSRTGSQSNPCPCVLRSVVGALRGWCQFNVATFLTHEGKEDVEGTMEKRKKEREEGVMSRTDFKNKISAGCECDQINIDGNEFLGDEKGLLFRYGLLLNFMPLTDTEEAAVCKIFSGMDATGNGVVSIADLNLIRPAAEDLFSADFFNRSPDRISFEGFSTMLKFVKHKQPKAWTKGVNGVSVLANLQNLVDANEEAKKRTVRKYQTDSDAHKRGGFRQRFVYNDPALVRIKTTQDACRDTSGKTTSDEQPRSEQCSCDCAIC
eukprot:TRINITY_DN11488_c0_g1_i6.p1 TRINITY_DN11488_c0_g1~~TRINITY_DN11488_c0_g1_i6.p1  ORF type:complete len:293 (-),score=44.96 TRINITY_DN11488_c0_g1_i6:396-1274(-)